MGKVNLKTLIEESKADSGLVFNAEGHVLDSHNISNENNIAAMAAVIITMSSEFFQDALNSKTLNQLVLASDEGISVINKYDDDHIVCLLAEDISKLAIIKLTLKKIIPQ